MNIEEVNKPFMSIFLFPEMVDLFSTFQYSVIGLFLSILIINASGHPNIEKKRLTEDIIVVFCVDLSAGFCFEAFHLETEMLYLIAYPYYIIHCLKYVSRTRSNSGIQNCKENSKLLAKPGAIQKENVQITY